MSQQSSFAYTSALDLPSAISTRAVSPVQVMQDCLVRVQQLETLLNCFVTATPEAAPDAARQAERAIKVVSHWVRFMAFRYPSRT